MMMMRKIQKEGNTEQDENFQHQLCHIFFWNNDFQTIDQLHKSIFHYDRHHLDVNN